LTLTQRKEIVQAYYASVSLVDTQVGRLLDALDEMGLSGSTVTLFVSDHGYHLGRHGLWQKGDLFEGSTKVPLLISGPGISGNRVSKVMTEMVDIYPTLAELSGLELPKNLKGRSLVPLLKEETQSLREAALTVAWSRAGSLHPEVRSKHIMGCSVRTARYRYTEWGGGRHGTELYDYETDPEEYTNLANDPGHTGTVKRMKILLTEAKKRAGVQTQQPN
jgi:arylsulfatase A-like enzyme